MFNKNLLPGIGHLANTYASMPVWSGSTKQPVQWGRMTKKERTKRFAAAEEFDRQTKRSGKHGGIIGHNALKVYHALLFGFYNFKTGQLDPSYDAIAKKANVCRKSVWAALNKLRGLGLLNWVRRCSDSYEDGRFVLRQETNAYVILQETQWRGFRPLPAPPEAPELGTWGEHPPMLDALSQYTADREMGLSQEAAAAALSHVAQDRQEKALAALYASLTARETRPQ